MSRNLLRSPREAENDAKCPLSSGLISVEPLGGGAALMTSSRAHPVSIWIVKLCNDASGETLDRAVSLLAPVEKARLAKLRAPLQREQFAFAHAALRQILGGHLNLPPKDVPIITRADDKPELAEGSLRFSLSHSGGVAAVALGEDVELGVDIEAERDLPELAGLAAIACTNQERSALRALGDDAQRRDLFLAFWTRKEAVLKATGIGARIPLRSVETAESPWVRVREPAGDRMVHVTSLSWPGASLAVAAVDRETDPAIRTFEAEFHVAWSAAA